MPFIETVRGPVTLSIDARDQLLDNLANLESGKLVAQAFKRAGLGEPVGLELDGKRVVVEAISRMSPNEVDPQLEKLREYLRDDLVLED